MFKKLLLSLVLTLISSFAYAVDITTTVCPGVGCTNIQTGGQGTIGIQITGTWVGTITFQSTIDNSTYTSLRVVSSADTTSAGVTTTTSNGSFQASVAGLSQVRVVFTAWVSGTASINARVVNQAAKVDGPSSGSIVAACGASDTQVLFVDGTNCAGDSSLTYSSGILNLELLSVGSTINPVTFSAPSDGKVDLETGAASGELTFRNTSGPNAVGAITVINSNNAIQASLYANFPTVGDTALLGESNLRLVTDNQIIAQNDFRLENGKSIQSDKTTAHTACFAGVYDVNAAAYSCAATGTNSNTPSYVVAPVGDLTVDVTTTLLTTSGSGLAVANVGANSCGTSAATIAGNSNSFEITVGATSGTQCRVTFPTAAPNRWNCTATDSTTTIATRATVVDTTHTDFFGAFVAGDVITALCLPR